jgi:hypothetical protein
MFPLSLARADAATRVLLLASVVTVLASVGVVVVARYELVVVALVVGAAVFATSATRAARRTLDRVTYLYVRAV